MSTLKIFTFNPFYENTYLVYNNKNEGIIIDPGCHDLAEQQELDNFIADNNIQIKKLINTHCHIDHVLGNDYVKTKYQVELGLHQKDLATYQAVGTYSANYGFPQYSYIEHDYFIEEGDIIELGELKFETLFCPGHAPGHIVFINHDEKYVIGGDVLFRQSIGRTDLPGGNHEELIDSIQKKLFKLPDDYIVFPGHGEPTDIGFEKSNNPFCKIR